MAAAMVLTVACTPGPPPAARTPTPTGSASAHPASGQASPCAAAAGYGLLIAAGRLELISPSGCVAATAAIGAPSVQACTSGLPAVLAPPVSASNGRVYYRDGDTRIRFLTPSGASGDATTVPGGPTTVSFFSVSPDDQRIAVLVEDLAPASTINLRLYVEDLTGGGHHADIYTTTIAKGQGGQTLWPMGWHQGRLVLAVVLACSASPVFHPVAWHVADAATGRRLATVDVSSCRSRLLPSPAGVACFDPQALSLRAYDWAGTVTAHMAAPFLSIIQAPGLSPSGQDVFLDRDTDWWAQAWSGEAGTSPITGHQACLWIDDGTILSPDAVTTYPSGVVTPLPGSGECAGRFPGGL